MQITRFARGLLQCLPGHGALYRLLLRIGPLRSAPTQPLDRGISPHHDPQALAAAYQLTPLAAEPERFVLYRILGNDLPPRHRLGQTQDNLRFILEHEPELDSCEKRFVVNRIVDPAEENAILRLLGDAGRPYLHIPFNAEEYRCLHWDREGVPKAYLPDGSGFAALAPAERWRVLMRLYRHKNIYVMHNNGARNAALQEGRRLAKWVLPWDGSCFVTAAGWKSLLLAVQQQPAIPYFIVPMARVLDNSALLNRDVQFDAREEPQVVFRRDALQAFDEDYYYGRRSKVELLWRLGVPGEWDNWRLEPWDLPAPAYAEDAGQFAWAGWVARLNSGHPQLEKNSALSRFHRPLARMTAVIGLLDALDASLGAACPRLGTSWAEVV